MPSLIVVVDEEEESAPTQPNRDSVGEAEDVEMHDEDDENAELDMEELAPQPRATGRRFTPIDRYD